MSATAPLTSTRRSSTSAPAWARLGGQATAHELGVEAAPRAHRPRGLSCRCRRRAFLAGAFLAASLLRRCLLGRSLLRRSLLRRRAFFAAGAFLRRSLLAAGAFFAPGLLRRSLLGRRRLRRGARGRGLRRRAAHATHERLHLVLDVVDAVGEPRQLLADLALHDRGDLRRRLLAPVDERLDGAARRRRDGPRPPHPLADELLGLLALHLGELHPRVDELLDRVRGHGGSG